MSEPEKGFTKDGFTFDPSKGRSFEHQGPAIPEGERENFDALVEFNATRPGPMLIGGGTFSAGDFSTPPDPSLYVTCGACGSDVLVIKADGMRCAECGELVAASDTDQVIRVRMVLHDTGRS